MNFKQRATNYHWVAGILIPVTVIPMEVFLVYPWLVWIGKWPTLVWHRPPLTLAASIVLMGAAYFATRYFLGRNWSLKWLQLSIIGCGLIVIFAVMRFEYSAGISFFNGQWFTHFGKTLLDSFSKLHPASVALVAGIYFWWRGISRGRHTPGTETIYPMLLVGIAASAGLIILWQISLGADSLREAAPAVVPQVAAFFFFGLAALALSNLQSIQRKLLPEDRTRVFNRRWLPILFGIVAGIVLAAIGLVSILSPQFIALLARAFDSALDVLYQVLLYLLIPLGYLAEALVFIARFILSFLRKGQPLQQSERPDFSISERLNQPTGLDLPEAAILAIKWTLFAIVIAAALFLLTRFISRYQASRTKTDVEEVDESLWSWDVFKADLSLFLHTLLQGLRRKRRLPDASKPAAARYGVDEGHRLLNVREIYRRFLWESARLGFMRRCHETPGEFARRWQQGFPGGSKQASDLTDLYIGVRYGEIELDDNQLNYANSIWHRLKRLLRPGEYQR